jgi:Gas vesicle synthesis protein GvpO
MADDKAVRSQPSAGTSRDGGRSSSGEQGSEGQKGSGQSSEGGGGGKPTAPSAGRRPEPPKEPAKRSPGLRIARRAAHQLLELTGKEPESIIGLKRTDDGWQVQLEVLEVNRIPHTTDLLALYQVDADSDGELVAYRRVSRYVRGSASEEGGR